MKRVSHGWVCTKCNTRFFLTSKFEPPMFCPKCGCGREMTEDGATLLKFLPKPILFSAKPVDEIEEDIIERIENESYGAYELDGK